MIVRVYHSDYGCDTGCCGHRIEFGANSSFVFTHPYSLTTEEEKRAWALELAKHTIKAEYPECFDLIDWDSIQYEVVDD